jgi:hypothetical protein
MAATPLVIGAAIQLRGRRRLLVLSPSAGMHDRGTLSWSLAKISTGTLLLNFEP